MAASPFRYEQHPSFFVNLDPESEFYGCWGDSGAVDDEWKSGNFTKLLSFLRAETYEETEEYLRYMYGAPAETNSLELRVPKLSIPEPQRSTLSADMLAEYETGTGTHEYLTARRINPHVQRLCRIGYDKSARAVTIPWFTADGKLGNVMYRTTYGKLFWYYRGNRKALPIRDLIFGLDIVYSRNIKRAAIVEAPIDAMTIMSAGMMAVATGGTAFGRKKAEMIRKSPLEEIVIVRDNDGPGRMWQRKVVEALAGGNMTVRIASVPRQYKDVNEWAQRIDRLSPSDTLVIYDKLVRMSKRVECIKPIPL